MNEYVKQGIIISERCGRTIKYSRAADISVEALEDMLCYFSEAAPCGVIGSFILDKLKGVKSIFSFKHHYITGTMDSDVMCELFEAMRERREITAEYLSKRNTEPKKIRVVPLRIFISAQNGRQYLLAWNLRLKAVIAYRLDNLGKIKFGEVCPQFDAFRAKLSRMQRHMWGVNCNRFELRTEHVEFTIHFDDDEDYILQRLEREKRCGKVELIDKNTAKFSADIYDCSELVPWIRTFICRLESVSFSNAEADARFKADLSDMYKMYGLGGEEA